MKRSNRLILLIGIFLAIVAFVGVIVIAQGGGGTTGDNNSQAITKATIVVAKQDIPLGSKITADMLTTTEVDAPAPVGTFGDLSFVIGQTARQNVTSGQAITTLITTGGANGGVANIEVPAGRVAIAIQVDQVTGVGTVIKAGDYIDMVVAITGDKFPVVTLNPTDQSITVVSGLNATSVKLLVQGGQVLGTLLPPPPADTTTGTTTQSTTTTNLNGQQEIVLVAVTAQQAEVIKYAEVDGNISLLLRSGDDFRDPDTGLPLDPTLIVPATTTGITLKSLVDDYGVLVPQLVEGIIPTATPRP